MISGAAPACRVRHHLSSLPRPTLSGDPQRVLSGAEALWAIKALARRTPPLFSSSAAAKVEPAAEIEEPIIALRSMTAGNEVVEDYGHVGLTLRQHPVAFLRDDLAGRRLVTCTQAMDARDGRWLEAAGLVLVRQRPGSAKGVMFITLEDETGIANLVVWPQGLEKFRRVVMKNSQHDRCPRPHPAGGRRWSPHRASAR